MMPVPVEKPSVERIPRPGRYRHFKGGEYELVTVARHSESEMLLVVYHQADHPQELWVRPVEMFLEELEIDGVSRARFELTGPRRDERPGLWSRIAGALAVLRGRSATGPASSGAHLSF
jgi:hypothetical protein